MALIGLDGFSEVLTTAISSTDAVLPVSGGAALCVSLGANTSKLVISDGVYREVVHVIGCLTGLPQVLRGQEGTQARSFVAGACVKYVLLTSSICELIAAGGCAAVATCVPLNVTAGKVFSDAESGLQYSHALAWEGTAPFTVTVLQKPSWMTSPPSGALRVRRSSCPASLLLSSQVTSSS